METIRKGVQIIWIFLVNSYWAFPWSKNLYQGPLKVLCSPGLNCYSCPAATTYCPLGSLQQLLLSVRMSLQSGSYFLGSYVLGSMGILAAFFGRFICGWACPFGLLQELLYKIPSPKYAIPKTLTLGKYFFLLTFVILLPLIFVNDFGVGSPWFCKYICPAGTLEAGIPMLLLMPELRPTVGLLFFSKMTIMVAYLGWSTVSSRAFCRTACPLGAFYALFNRYSLIRLKFVADNCTKCGACHSVCPVDIRFNETPYSGECVKCLRCMSEACTFDAITLEISGYQIGQRKSPQPNNVKG